MAFITVPGLNIRYEEYGDGPPLLLVHGLGGSLDTWAPAFVAALAERHRVVAFDNRGSGMTETIDEGRDEYSIGTMASDAANLLRAMHIGRTYLLGHSLGGMVAQQVALDAPDQLDRLVLCSTNCGGLECIGPADHPAGIPASGKGTLEEQVCDYIATQYPPAWLAQHEDDVQVLTRHYLEVFGANDDTPGQFLASVAFDACGRLHEIPCPTLVACGTEDDVIPAANSRLLAERIPEAELVEYRGAGHDFFNRFPLEFAETVTRFLA